MVVKGLSQVPRIDYSKTFVLVAKMNSIRLILVISIAHHWEDHKMDAKSDFLHSDLQEEIYMEKPQWFI